MGTGTWRVESSHGSTWLPIAGSTADGGTAPHGFLTGACPRAVAAVSHSWQLPVDQEERRVTANHSDGSGRRP